MTTAQSPLLLMGVVARAHGLRGEIVVTPHHAGSPLWKAGTMLAFLAPTAVSIGARHHVAAEPLRMAEIQKARRGPDGRWTLVVDGVADRDAAESMRGQHVAVPVASLPAPADDEVYHHELPGWDVVDTAGQKRGVVVGIVTTPASDLIDLDIGGGVTVYVPWVPAIVKEVDRVQRRLVIDPPEGLLEP